MMLPRPRDTRLLRQVGSGIAALAVVQVLLLQPHRLLAGTSGLVVCVALGLAAFLAWLVAEWRWPLVAWVIVVLFVAIDAKLPTPTAAPDPFGEFADGPPAPAPLLFAHGPSPSAHDRLTRNGD